MTKLFLATLVVLGAASANAEGICNPDQTNCPVRVTRSNDGVGAKVEGAAICNPEQQACVVVAPAGVPAWLEKLNGKAPGSWKAVSPFTDSKGQ